MRPPRWAHRGPCLALLPPRPRRPARRPAHHRLRHAAGQHCRPQGGPPRAGGPKPRPLHRPAAVAACAPAGHAFPRLPFCEAASLHRGGALPARPAHASTSACAAEVSSAAAAAVEPPKPLFTATAPPPPPRCPSTTSRRAGAWGTAPWRCPRAAWSYWRASTRSTRACAPCSTSASPSPAACTSTWSSACCATSTARGRRQRRSSSR